MERDMMTVEVLLACGVCLTFFVKQTITVKDFIALVRSTTSKPVKGYRIMNGSRR